MRRAALALAAAATLTLSACGGADTATTGDSGTDSASPTAAATAPPNTSPTAAPSAATPVRESGFIDYDAYSADAAALHAAGDVVLFFNASWCPTCKRTVANLEGDPAAIPADLTIVSVDYDSATDLKRQYGVTYQHTFVQVDEAGAELAKWSGSETADQIAGKTV